MMPRTIMAKLAWVIVFLILFVVSLLAFVLLQNANGILKNQIEKSHQEIAAQIGQRTTLVVERPKNLLEMTASYLGRTNLTSWQQETLLVELSLRFPMFEKAMLIDLSGEMIASSNPGEKALNQNDQSYFKEASKGETYFSSIYIGDNHLPHMTIALPYYRFSEVAGILMAEVNMRGIWDIIDAIRIGETGHAFLISETGWILAHPDKKLVLQHATIKDNPALQDLIESGGQSVEYKGGDGRAYLAAYALIPTEIPLRVIVQMDAKEAHKPLESMQAISLFIIVISVLLAIFVSIVLSRKLVNPIKLLHGWSQKIALEDYDYHIPAKSTDEIGQLFIRFERMSRRLKASREREQLAAFGEAAASISHKLKNAIVSLKTFAQLLPEQKNDEKFMKKFEERFALTIDHLEELFTNLSRISSARRVQKASLDFAQLLEKVCEGYRELAEEQLIQLQFFSETEEIPFYGDREQLEELFSNLIQNAIQAMPTGGQLVVKIGSVLDTSMISVTISDTGPGISEGNARKIFTPFFTTKQDGMGLGLSIAQKIVRNHKGSLTAFNHKDGHGCSFQLMFPRLDKAAFSPENRSFSRV